MPGRGTSGFTLIEMMLSLALTVTVMAMTLPFVHVQKRLWVRQEEEREAGRALAGALAWISRDLVQAGYHVPGPPLRQLEEASIAYVLSRDEDDPLAFSPLNRRLVTVFLDGHDLKYRIQAPALPPTVGWAEGSTQVLASGIGAMHCRGLDQRALPTTMPEAVAVVACEMRADSGAVSSTAVRLRVRGAGPPP